MKEWVKLSLTLCAFGVLREFRPSEPYVTKYLNNPPMNLTLEEIYSDVYPVGTYSNMVLLILIFLCTDMLKYKPVIVLNGLCGMLCYIMLIVCRQLFEIQIVEILYGLFMACDVAYCTYIYSKVDKDHYQEVTSHTHGAYLAGRAISGVASQLLVSSHYFSYYDLNFFTLGGMMAATIWSLFLPPVGQSVYFHRNHSAEETGETINNAANGSYLDRFIQKITKGSKFLVQDLISAFTNYYVVKWVIWWTLATCGYYQTFNYFQVLWEVIDEESTGKKDFNWNGAVEATYTGLSVVATLACGKAKVNWVKYAEFILALCSATIGLILFVASQTNIIYVAYAADISSKIIYHGMITIANSEVAKNINPDSYALIFGINNFFALVLQSLLTFVVNSTLKLPARVQFVIYSVYFLSLGLFFGIISVVLILQRKRETLFDDNGDLGNAIMDNTQQPETNRLTDVT